MYLPQISVSFSSGTLIHQEYTIILIGKTKVWFGGVFFFFCHVFLLTAKEQKHEYLFAINFILNLISSFHKIFIVTLGFKNS